MAESLHQKNAFPMPSGGRRGLGHHATREREGAQSGKECPTGMQGNTT
jgi:hypothetical protein